VRQLNRQFSALSQEGVFATAIVATFFAPCRRLAVCNAGHPRPLVYRAKQRHWDFLSHDEQAVQAPLSNMPLGLLEMSDYEQFDVDLEPGDCVVTYTDALMESNDTGGQMLGEKGVLKIARSLPEMRPQKLVETLLAEIAGRHPGNLSHDDVTVLVVRANGGQPHYSVGEKLSALGRFSRSLARAINPRAERPPFPDANLANLGGAIIPALARRWRPRRTPGP
jgi:sigma-B regulation protein RsbU (phosphoserine phosphatase)